jgi:hypothetical protein
MEHDHATRPMMSDSKDKPLTKAEKDALPASANALLGGIDALVPDTPSPTPPRPSSPAPPPTRVDVVFTKGVPSRVSVKHLVPPGERYQGGFYDAVAGYHSYVTNLVGVTFDARTCELVYDGRDPDPHKIAENPSRSYWIGSEASPCNSHWQWPPTAMPIPQPVRGMSKALANPSKHTAAVYCPWNQHICLFGGDFSTWGLLEGGMNGRAVMWNWNPVANTWALGFQPPGGLAGDVIPLSPDIMGMCWDSELQRFFIAWGVSRPGFADAAQWASFGYKATPYPANNMEADPAQMPCFTFDPKAARPKYELAGVGTPWPIATVHEIAYDAVTHRVYAVKDSNDGIRVYYLDTHGSPLAWKTLDISLAVGAPGNLTGSGEWTHPLTGYWPLHVDEKGRRLLFMDARTPAVLAVTLPGHARGEGKVQLVARLPVVSLATAAMGLAASIAGAWIPEHRSLVILWEPLFHQVGPYSARLTVDVDTGAITEGPRWPNYDAEARPWFPNQAVWYPPTLELIVYGYMYDNSTLPNVTVPQTNYRYKWLP